MTTMFNIWTSSGSSGIILLLMFVGFVEFILPCNYLFVIWQAVSYQDKWRGIPTRLNNIPHSREIRQYFYNDVLQATQNAVQDKRTRLKVRIFLFFFLG